MALRQLPAPKWTVPGNSGGVASGWKVYTYAPGTTTAKNTYTDSTGGTANANPVVLDSRGEASIWWDGTYKVVVKDQNDVTKFTEDNYGEGLDPVAVPQLSLVKNYSFETATVDANTPDNWTITLYTAGTQILDDSAGNQIHGAKSLKFTSAGTGGGYAESDFFGVQESVSVQITFAMKSSVADVRNLIELVWYDRSESLLSTSTILDDSTTNQTSWVDETGVATAPSNARFAKLRLTGCHSSDSTVGSTWFDNISVFAITGSEALRITRGTIGSAAGTITEGGGWSVVKNSTGDFTVTFTTAFSDVPSVVATGLTSGTGNVIVTACSASAVTLQGYNTANETVIDFDIMFIAIGPQ